MEDILIAGAAASAGLLARGDTDAEMDVHGYYIVECFDIDGNLKWRDEIHNLVTTVGKNLLLDSFLAGSSYTTTIYMGLKGTGSAAAGDTMASHAGWLEVGGANAPTYSGTRKTPSFSAASSGSKQTSSAVTFGITSSGTVAGVFTVMSTGASTTIDNTGGTLFSAGDFSGGSRSVINGDTLSVTYTVSV